MENCPTGKAVYADVAAAQKYLAAVRKRHWNRRDERHVHAYRCAECGGWHVGHIGRRRHRLLVGALEEAEGVPPPAEWSRYLPSSMTRMVDRDRPRPRPAPDPPPSEDTAPMTATPPARPRRVTWGPREEQPVLAEALRLARAGGIPYFGDLVRAAQLVLEPGLRRNLVTVAHKEFPWIVDGLKAEGLWPLGSRPAIAATPAAPPAAVAAVPGPPAAAPALPDAAGPGPTPRELFELVRRGLAEAAADRDRALREAEEARAGRARAEAQLAAVAEALERMELAYLALGADFVELRDLVEDLATAPRPDAPADAPPAPASPRREPAPATPAGSTADLLPIRLHHEPAAASPPAAARPKVAMVGYLHDQFNQVLQKVGGLATLIEVDSRAMRGTLPTADYYLLSRHNDHAWKRMAAGKVVDERRVIRLRTTGLSTAMEEIRRIAREFAPAGEGAAAAR